MFKNKSKTFFHGLTNSIAIGTLIFGVSLPLIKSNTVYVNTKIQKIIKKQDNKLLLRQEKYLIKKQDIKNNNNIIKQNNPKKQILIKNQKTKKIINKIIPYKEKTIILTTILSGVFSVILVVGFFWL